MKKILQVIGILLSVFSANSQDTFDYSIELNPISIPNLEGLHSFAFAQSNGRWLIVGGRRDGLHARQPFNAFPSSQNNTDLTVVDVNSMEFWTASVSILPTPIKEQLQSTNMNFYQEGDTLYVIGGYAYSESVDDHITFPYLTTISVSGLMDAIVEGNSILPYFKNLNDPIFEVTGGQLGKIGNQFYLVGGQKFTGRYNPMGNPTYTQEYSIQIKKFTVDNSSDALSFSNYTNVSDPVHLRRRDYNLLPQIFDDGSEGYLISSGVFQEVTDLPFLYPVQITETDYTPITEFNQYLSNYHSAHASMYDSDNHQMHSLFFGGMSRYYYQNGELIEDSAVPFVKTISRLSQWSDGSMHEYNMPEEMMAFNGASAEFIPNLNLPRLFGGILDLNNINENTFLIGHIYGGINSNSLNPFSSNQTSTTSAASTIYEVILTKNTTNFTEEVDGKNPFFVIVSPNPAGNFIDCQFELKSSSTVVEYSLSTANGTLIKTGSFTNLSTGLNRQRIDLSSDLGSGNLMLTVSFDHRFFTTSKVIIK